MRLSDTKILIVEDEPIVSHDIRTILERMGLVVTAIAPTADEALAAIERDPPHLILLDLSLSGQFDGVDLARAVQLRWKIPVIFISGHLGDGEIGGVDEIEAAGFVAKPFYPVNLREAVALALRLPVH